MVARVRVVADYRAEELRTVAEWIALATEVKGKGGEGHRSRRGEPARRGRTKNGAGSSI